MAQWLRWVLGSFSWLALSPAQSPIAVPDGADGDAVVALATTVRPSPRQVAWQQTGFNAFVHFGMNTFTDREWGDGKEDPRTFAPTAFAPEQWFATFRAAGMKGLVLTAKHHDGFCLWPSKTTDHDVAASPFRGGKGDVVAEVAAACRAAGMLFGVYLSPWDRNQASFGTPAYQAVFQQQLRELCSNYGPLFEVWFDGAHCPPDDPALFDWQAAFRIVRELQPAAVIAITGPDVRWVGNEAGHTRAEEWSVLPLPSAAPGAFELDRASWRALWALRERNEVKDLGSRNALAGAKGLCWWAAETDVSIRPGWFHHPSEDASTKSLSALLDTWFGAVGGNAVLLLNVPADRRGRIADVDVAVLHDLGRVLDGTFGKDYAAGAATKTYAKAGEVYFDKPTTIDVFELAENVAEAGQRVEAFRIDVFERGGWRQCARGTTVGFRRLLRTAPITGDGFRYWIERSRAAPKIAKFGLYRRPDLLPPPVIRRRVDGLVAITATRGAVHYTLDGAPVTAASPRYVAPFALPLGGVVSARVFADAGDEAVAVASSTVASATFGMASQTWKVLDCSSEQGGREAASKAFDGDPSTHWHTRYGADTPMPPHHLAIDLGRTVDVRGFVYQPRRDGSNGTVAEHEFHGSIDGIDWQLLARGTFDNIESNPMARVVELPAPVTGLRYVKFVARREVRGRPWASCAELSVLIR